MVIPVLVGFIEFPFLFISFHFNSPPPPYKFQLHNTVISISKAISASNDGQIFIQNSHYLIGWLTI